nr:MAG TPA: Host cell surface-exposed lipoprotein [Caudoviricetes sp.]
MKKQTIIAIITTATIGFATLTSVTGCSNNEPTTTQSTVSKDKTNKPKVKVKKDESATQKQKEAYDSARSYYSWDGLSEKGFYEQLEAEGYSEEEIQYALNRLKPDYNKMAVRCAKGYYDSRYAMSAQGIYDELVDDWNGFTSEQAEYAVNHLGVDYNEAALEKAKIYAEEMDTIDQIYSQLEYEQFTPEQIQYAIDHLNN